ncbi:Glycine receptor subunit alpha-4-like 4, partial [Homarus americanus]
MSWYHLCFTYDHQKHLYNTFVDGEVVYELNYNVGRQIYGDRARIGQGGPLYQSFSGALSQVNVWDYVVAAETIADMAACRSDVQGNFISWQAGWILSNFTEYDVPLEHFCKQTKDAIYFGFPSLSKDEAFYICEALGSHLPLPTTVPEAFSWTNISKRIWPDWFVIGGCNGFFWSSINDLRDEGIWVTHFDNAPVTNIPWKDGEPNGLFYENCAFVETEGIADIDCLTNRKCAVCEFSDLQIFSFLGTCELQLRNIHLIAYQEDLGELHFKGYGEYLIHKVGEEWLWINVVHNKTMARLDPSAPFNMPMGRRVWQLETTVCDQSQGARTLLLTTCQSDSYTCDDATCIPLENRCDQKYDCLDRSDEVDCELVSMPKDYKMNLPPRLGNDKDAASLPVAFKISIESATIHTTQMTMQLSYEIQMFWLDNRLTFRNLKVNDSLNKVPYTRMMSMWWPTVGFVNTEGHQHTTVDLESTLNLLRERSPERRANNVPGEVDLFLGKDNSIRLTRKYSTIFVCDFNLMLYPFDIQHCDMHLRMLSGPKNYLMLEQPQLVYDNSGEFSEIRVKITLQRRSGYAVLNIYTPSMILLIISYVSLFFRSEIFEVRIMTTLTSLLVLATLFTQVSASLPKTSYFKMVDVWLLFCIIIGFIIIIFHTIIDYSLKKHHSGDRVSPFPAPVKGLHIPITDRHVTQTSINAFLKYLGFGKSIEGLIVISRLNILAIFTFFNLIYW